MQVICRIGRIPLRILETFLIGRNILRYVQEDIGLFVVDNLLPSPIEFSPFFRIELHARLVEQAVRFGVAETGIVGSTVGNRLRVPDLIGVADQRSYPYL